jgi:dolichol kinase
VCVGSNDIFPLEKHFSRLVRFTMALSDMLHLELSPFYNNLLASQIMLLSFKLAIEFARRGGRKWYSRELLHVFLSNTILFWRLFDTSCWSWRLNALVPAIMVARFMFKGCSTSDPEDIEVQTLSRSSSPSDLLYGPMQFAGIVLWLGLTKFMTQEACIVHAALLGDVFAPMIGTYGRHMYQMPLAAQKTVEGSVVGVFLGTVFISYLYLSVLQLPLLPLRVVLAYGGIAALAEATSLNGFDNLVLAITLHFSIPKALEWLPA